MTEIGYLVAVAVAFFLFGWLVGDDPVARRALKRSRVREERMVRGLRKDLDEWQHDRRPW